MPTRHSFKHTFCREIALLSNLRGALEIIHQNQSKVKFGTNEGNFSSPEHFFRIGSPLLLSERDKKEYTYLQTAVIVYGKLEDDPRSTPGHSKVLDQIRAIMKLMIVVSTVGLTKKLLRCYVDVQKHLKQLLKYPNQS